MHLTDIYLFIITTYKRVIKMREAETIIVSRAKYIKVLLGESFIDCTKHSTKANFGSWPKGQQGSTTGLHTSYIIIFLSYQLKWLQVGIRSSS